MPHRPHGQMQIGGNKCIQNVHIMQAVVTWHSVLCLALQIPAVDASDLTGNRWKHLQMPSVIITGSCEEYFAI